MDNAPVAAGTPELGARSRHDSRARGMHSRFLLSYVSIAYKTWWRSPSMLATVSTKCCCQ
jgi:hypothetical protein